MANPNPQDFTRIPGVGPKIAQDIWDLGFQSVQELQEQDPDEMYLRLCAIRSKHIDRCMLYVFRTAVYYASMEQHDPDLLQWWNWKD